MNKNNTPDPWENCGTYVIDTKGLIADCYIPYRGRQENLANAKLIAASKELLEALQLLKDVCKNKGYEIPANVFFTVNFAIQKAEQ